MVGTLVLGTSAEMRQGSSPYLGTQMLEWWNWQARQIQNLLSRNTRVGSTPTSSTKCLVAPNYAEIRVGKLR